ncbi:hypothetical protein MCOR28_001271 [Pyricularia oryzae]|uniref:Beta-lactamase-related domain-containing protein n=1 Tax=Pyricularia grisea TaxID=148305 RepID=A0ABQ8P1D7_PYRGI|nr:hypothetical protein MCOR26_010345 [Pyricularia oryzae]KAI6305075.1 hypothetical protein MCOR33_000192 [Pyricularia grisea]KAI6349182.1 hypothetical protein MCOR28_001271 [Pyricularia oryzae]
MVQRYQTCHHQQHHRGDPRLSNLLAICAALFTVAATIMFTTALLLTLAGGVALVTPAPLNCPIQGAAFPKPRDLASSPTMQAAFRNLTATFEAQAAGAGGGDTSFSVELWSVSDPGGRAPFEFHHTARELAGLENNAGVKKVDGDTVYRIGSLTKVFTVYTWLVEVGDKDWSTPITRFVPELAEIAMDEAEAVKRDPIMRTNWEEITVGALASQLAGIIRDYAQVGEMGTTLDASTRAALGLPPLPPADIPPCGPTRLCDREQFFQGMGKVPPQYGPNKATVYSDTAFQILAYALEHITGKTYGDMLHDSVLAPLKLNRTYLFKPDDSVGIIPANGNNAAAATGWSYSIGEAAPTGNMYASSSDLSRAGRGILSSALMTPALTGRWLKPASLTSELIAAVGYPWGVRRIDLSRSPRYKRVTDAYNKAGRIGSYAALMALLPDFDAGFSIMLAGNSLVGNPTFSWADTMGGVLIPALEQTAREQADALYSGRYHAAAGGLNSSLEISTSPDRLGLGVYRWISNGTDMQRAALFMANGAPPTNPSIRLYPTGLETAREGGGRKVAFKAVFEDLTGQATDLMFTTDCGTWVGATSVVVGDVPLDQFAFNLDSRGRVESVEPMALRVVLNKGA